MKKARYLKGGHDVEVTSTPNLKLSFGGGTPKPQLQYNQNGIKRKGSDLSHQQSSSKEPVLTLNNKPSSASSITPEGNDKVFEELLRREQRKEKKA